MLTCCMGSRARKFVRNQDRDPSTAISSSGIASLPSREIARPARYILIGARTRPPPNCGLGTAPGEQCLINIVMQDASKTSHVLAAKITRKFFSKRVADRVRMPKTFSLDDFCRRIVRLERRDIKGIHRAT